MSDNDKKFADDRGSVKLPPDLHKALSLEAVQRGITRAALIDELWKAYKSHGATPHKRGVDEPSVSALDSEVHGKLSEREFEAWKEFHKRFGKPGGIFTLLKFMQFVIDSGGTHGSTADIHHSGKKGKK